jgi:hypothetical protein
MTAETPPAAALWSEWQRLASRSWRSQLSLAQETWDIARRTPVGDARTTSALNQAYVDAAWRESQRYWTEAMSLGLDYADGLVTLAQRSAARVLDVVAPATTADHTAQPPPRRVPVELSGPVGGAVTTRVTVANRQRQTRRVTFTIGQMVGGGATFMAPLTVSPHELVLAPAEERDVELRLQLDPGRFSPDTAYYADVHIEGGDNVTLALEVRPH